MTNMIALITAAFSFGIWCAGYCNWLLPLLYGSSMIFMIMIVWQIYRDKSVIWSVGVLFFLIGMIRCIHDDALAPMDISRYAGRTMMVEGTVIEMPKVTPLEDGKSKVRYVIAIKKGQEADKSMVPMTGALIVSMQQPSTMPTARQDDEVRVTGQVVLLHGYNNPAQYDSVAAARRQDVRARMSIQSQDIHIMVEKKNMSWKHVLALEREKIIEHMKKVMPESHAGILAGMLFGGYGGIPREIVADFATTGIVHILSVSGSHIALVVGIITALGTILARRFTLHAIVVPFVAAMVVTFYAIFCGLTPPVMRSLIMGLIALVAVCFEREKDAANALLLSALGMLIYQPGLIYDLSFQLSFASTAGLVFLSTKTAAMLSFMPSWLAKLSAVTISAQLGVLPFIAWYFNSFSLSSLVANVIIVPLIEGLVVVGLCGAMCSMLFEVVGNLIFVLCSLLISVIVQCTAWLAAMPAAKVYIPSFGIGMGMVYYVLLAWIYGYKPKNMLSLIEVVKRYRCQSQACLLLIVICIILYNVYPRPMYVHFIDVGQGDAALVITPHGRAILIDAGGVMGDTTDFDIGDRVVVPYLRHYGVLAIDYLFLTHGHQDHAGGAAANVRELPVKNSMLARENYTQAVRNVVHSSHGSVFIPVYEGQRIEMDGVIIKIVHAVSGANIQQKNEVSSVVQVCYGQHSFLFTGDLEKNGEQAIVASGNNLASTVLKVGHHGARTSSTVDFLQSVAPEYAVISVGKNNRFGHPHADTVSRLMNKTSKIYRTDEHGAIVFQTDGKKIAVETFIK